MKRFVFPVCATLAVLVSLGCWEFTTYFAMWERLESGSTPTAAAGKTADAAQAQAFVLRTGSGFLERPILMQAFQRADRHYFYERSVWPLVRCEGYYGLRGDVETYRVFRINDDVFVLFDVGAGPRLRRGSVGGPHAELSLANRWFAARRLP